MQSISVERRDELLVYGYIKHEAKKLKVVISKDLIKIFYSFYHLNCDKWDIELSNKQFLKFNDQIVTNTNDKWKRVSMFGTNLVSAPSVKTWRIRIISANHRQWNEKIMFVPVAIGVIKDSDGYSDNSDKVGFGWKSYDFTLHDGHRWHWNTSKNYTMLPQSNDIILITLDMTDSKSCAVLSVKTIKRSEDYLRDKEKFEKALPGPKYNNYAKLEKVVDKDGNIVIDHGIAFNNIDVNNKYKLAVHLYYPNDTIELLE